MHTRRLRIWLAALLPLLPPRTASAQSWELVAGMGASVAPAGRLGPVVVVGVQRDLSTWLSARAELRYTRKAGTGEVLVCEIGTPAPCPPADARFDWRTLELPVFLAASPSAARPFYFVAGGYAGRHIRCRSDIRRADDVTPVPNCELARAEDVGLAIGAGVEFQVADHPLRIETRYARGLIGSVGWDIPSDVIVRPSVATLVLTYVWRPSRSGQPPN